MIVDVTEATKEMDFTVIVSLLVTSPLMVTSSIYQLPLILSALSHVAWYSLSISWHVPLSGNDDVALFNDVAYDAE